ncbi:IS4 family transposase [Staphylococcus sp. 47.1]|uniref:IS4 family transposase n=1 Tax=Staphylococcus sp. 47.1 TaxID=1929484 RepID=UPI000946EC6E|nr:IS4 family transposase [Staphylococcus sp. 47.1]OLF30224.1 transposase [Staphylococcus sp. 47.1]
MTTHILYDFGDFMTEAHTIYMEDIREGNPQAFTRKRKTTPYQLMLQMFSQKGNTQFSELLNFYAAQGQPLDISTVAFYKARMKYNPNALWLMMKDYMSKIYEERNRQLVKLNGYIITAIDGSDIVLPSTQENAEKYGRHVGPGDVSPVMGKISLLYDCVNKLVIDTRIGRYKHSEQAFAAEHLVTLKETLRQPTITTFDRGYFSMRLVDQMCNANQKFVIRMNAVNLKRYTGQVASGEDRTFNMQFDRLQTNGYRQDHGFRNKVMNTTYPLRVAKIPLTRTETGEIYDEILLTNLTAEECSMTDLKEIYRLRWSVETAYNILKNRMKLEEFSGVRERLILQDIYCCVWLYNLTMLQIIEGNETTEIPQDRYKYEMKRNMSITIGVVKTYFIKALMSPTQKERRESMKQMNTLIMKHLVPIRPNRSIKRKTSVNKSRRSYRYTY